MITDHENAGTEITRSRHWLDQDEIDDFCRPLKQHAAQIRFMRQHGLTVTRKPGGAPLVIRSHFEQVMNPGTSQAKTGKREPNRAGLVASFVRA